MTSARARALGLAALVVTVVAETLSVAWTAGVAPLSLVVMYAVYSVAGTAAGARIVATYPTHRIGWLLVVIGTFNAVAADLTLAYGVRATVTGWPGGVYGEAAGYSTFFVAALPLLLFLLLFPDGRLLSPRWCWAVLAWAFGAAALVPGWVLAEPLGESLTDGVNPLARDLPLQAAAFAVGMALVCGALVVALASLLLRWRRAAGVERDQLTWVVLSAVVVGVSLPVSGALWNVTPLAQVLAALALCTMPAAAYVAILRHGLYDVDLVVSRTVTYAALTALLAAAYVGVVLAVGTLAPTPVAAAAAALLVAVVARPVRDRAQDLVDRRFRRARWEAHRQLADFAERVRRGEAQPEQVEDALRSALDDPGLSLLVGTAPPHPEVPGRVATEVTEGLPVVVRVAHRPEDAAVLGAAVDAGRLALDLAALQVGLRSQLAEVAASRARLVEVADEERRRLARDLHDGAQQRLVAIGLTLRHAQHLGRGSGAAPDRRLDAALDSAVAELTNAIDELRELASGLRPAALDAGLGSALREVASRAPLPVLVRAGDERFAADAEATAYFIASEGLTNALKHAGATQVEITAERDADDLVVTVADDGRGGADPGRGQGLEGLLDRARARGGSLAVESPGGRGTRLVARFPCG